MEKYRIYRQYWKFGTFFKAPKWTLLFIRWGVQVSCLKSSESPKSISVSNPLIILDFLDNIKWSFRCADKPDYLLQQKNLYLSTRKIRFWKKLLFRNGSKMNIIKLILLINDFSIYILILPIWHFQFWN